MCWKILVFACLLSVETVFAWGQNGHRIVAQICYDNLSPTSQQKVSSILGDNYITQIATWPDFIRSESNWDFTKPWHFITIDPSKNVEDILREGAKNQTIDNVIEAIELMKAILNNDTAARNKFKQLMDDNKVEPLSGSIDATALAFLVHFIGDIHQPMHVGKNEDFGGNKIIVDFFSTPSNLHSVWDSDIIEQEGLSFSEFATFVNKHEMATKSKCEKDPITKWASESVLLREEIYNTLYNTTNRDSGLPSMSYQYQHDYLSKLEGRLAKAGYRAAAILNTIFN